ncbi:MAG: mechanosensitive ion channel family protein, partial [Gammaproteobacteria bacterium]
MVDTYIVPWAIRLVMALVIFVFGRIVVRMICGLVRKMMTKGDVDSILSDFLITILRSLLLLVVVIAALNQLGVDTTSMIALVGAAGLAVGLALQGTLSNFAAGVMLILFRPFEDGDFVEAAGVSG